MKNRRLICGARTAPGSRGLGAGDAAVIIVILVIAAVLNAAAGMSLPETLALILGSGMIGALVKTTVMRDGGGGLAVRVLTAVTCR